MVPGLLFTYGLVALMLTVNALRRPVPPTSRLPPLWLPAMLTAEMAPVWFVTRLVVAGVAGWADGTRHPLGVVGLALLITAQVGLVAVMARNHAAVGHALTGVDTDRPAVGLWERVAGRPIPLPEQVELVRDIEYHPPLTLDLYRRSDHSGEPSPTLVYVHGGSWTGGGPHRQSRPLFHHLARRGWVVATIRYPLSPDATHPDHLIGVKRAIAWCKTSGLHQGIDPTRIAIAGGSAGAHLASLAALTAHRTEYQPGFEEADTSVSACVPMYGVYDFLNRNRTRWDWPVIPRSVIKATAHEAPEAYRSASPIDQTHADAPPFLVIHGTLDSLVPPAEARHFVEALASVSAAPVELHEVPGAQHAFDAVSSARTRAVTTRITHFLESHLRADTPPP